MMFSAVQNDRRFLSSVITKALHKTKAGSSFLQAAITFVLPVGAIVFFRHYTSNTFLLEAFSIPVIQQMIRYIFVYFIRALKWMRSGNFAHPE